MKSLPALRPKQSFRGKRVLLRVDWNIPIVNSPTEEDLLKIQSSIGTIRELQHRGARVILMTHLGRPKKRESSFSTARLLPFAESYLDHPLVFCEEDLSIPEGRAAVKRTVDAGRAGDVFLLENVRFYSGEEKNQPSLAVAYASLADFYVNDAFASCHRRHASVCGIPKLLPHAAGPQLVKEVDAMNRLIQSPKKPFVALIGGSKLSTKIPLLSALLQRADTVLIGGAMAHVFFAARGLRTGKSLVEKESIAVAKKLLKNKKIMLPKDVLVASSLKRGVRPGCVSVDRIGARDIIGDIGTDTMQEWSAVIREAKTLLWNGPVGVSEIPAFSHGSLVLGSAIASRSRGSAYGVVGGGDTVPVAMRTGMAEWFDHLSMGGGAMLEFLVKKGKLPGITALMQK